MLQEPAYHVNGEVQKHAVEWQYNNYIQRLAVSHKRRDVIQHAARIILVVFVVGSVAFLLSAALDLTAQLQGALNNPPPLSITATASRDATSGTVCAFNQNGTIACGGLSVNATSLSLGPAFVNARPVSQPSNPLTLLLAGFSMSTTSSVEFSLTEVATSPEGSPLSVGASVVATLTFSPSLSTGPISVLASGAGSTFVAVVTIHGSGSSGRTLMLSVRGTGAPTNTAFSQVSLGTTSAVSDAALSTSTSIISVVPFAAGVALVYPVASTCVAVLFSPTGSSLGVPYDLSLLGVSTCPNSTAVIYDDATLIIPSSPVIVLSIDAASGNLSGFQTIPVVYNAAPAQVVLGIIPSQVVGYAGFAAAVLVGAEVIVQTFSLAPGGYAYVPMTVTSIRPRSVNNPAWSFATIEDIVYSPSTQSIAVVTRDSFGNALLAFTNVAISGDPSELLSISGYATFGFGPLFATASGTLISVMRPDGSTGDTIGILAAVSWNGGYRVSGVSATVMTAGSSASVAIAGMTTALSNLRSGQQYALGSDGSLVLAASITGSCIVFGEAVASTVLDITLRHNRNSL